MSAVSHVTSVSFLDIWWKVHVRENESPWHSYRSGYGPDVEEGAKAFSETILVATFFTFNGEEHQLMCEGREIMYDGPFRTMLNENGIGYKSIQEYIIETFDGNYVRYGRRYRGQAFRRKKKFD